MASLHKLLSGERFERQTLKKPQRKVKFKEEESIALPIYICHDRRSLDSSIQRAEKAFSLKGSSRRGGSGSERSNYTRREGPAIDGIAIKATVSILNGYVGQYLRDKNFRDSVREKCYSCLSRRKHLDNEMLTHLKMGIRSIERLVEIYYDTKREIDIDSLQNCVKLLDVVASFTSNSKSGTHSSYPSACAHLYLSVLYKTDKNDRISARHLLQVFCDSPFLARTHLLPELWEHLFLPHLLHLKIWSAKELEFLSGSDYVDKEKKIKALNKLYNNQMDTGTIKFALYYKEWLKVGAQAPSIPSMPLPTKLSYTRSRRRSADSLTSHHSVQNKSLYQEVFGPTLKGRSDNRSGSLRWDLVLEETGCSSDEDAKSVEKNAEADQSPPSQSSRMQKVELRSDSQRTENFRFLACRTDPREWENSMHKNDDILTSFQSNDITSAIEIICSSGSLKNCEMAIRTVSKGWLNSHGDPRIENLLSRASVIQGIIEVLFVSSEDEILELAISILAVLATKREINRQFILNSDPQLEVSMRLLRSGSLFLKAAALLYLVKPKAKQMVSAEWIPLVLRVLEFGDHLQTLFTVKCSPHEAAYFFLDQLLTGFTEDKNIENTKQIVSLGGLTLLVRRMEEGDTFEKSKAASVLYYCIQADGSCRHYLAKNLKKDAILSLLVLGKQTNSQGCALDLLAETLCLSRSKHKMESLSGLTKGWDCFNTMHILLAHLQKARAEERPIIAAILLLLDLMGDPLECSIYREEAIDALVKALDCLVFDEKVQEQAARALLILGGYFSYTGEPEVEKWLLRKARFDENNENYFFGKDVDVNGFLNLSEGEKSNESLQRKSALVLLRKGNKRLVSSLTNSIGYGIPCLARASLVTLCWMSCGFSSLGDKDFQFVACSILVPQLIQSLNYDRAFEERILASYCLLTLSKSTDCFSNASRLDEVLVNRLSRLREVTWTAEELISRITRS